MGDPKKPKKSYRRPRRIWTSDQLSSELYVVGSYGLRNKKELWKAQTKVANFRNQARTLLALTDVVGIITLRDEELEQQSPMANL